MVPSHFLNQCWNIVNWTLGNNIQWDFNWNSSIFIKEKAFQIVVCEMASIFSRPQWVNIMRPEWNVCHVTDHIFMCIFWNEKYCTLIQNSLKFLCKGPINNMSSCVGLIAWHWTGLNASAVDKPKFMGRPPDHPWWKSGLPESFLGCPNYFDLSLKEFVF